MQSRSNVMAERLPERPILGFYENVRNVSHTTFRHSRVCTVVLVNLSRNITGTTYVFGCSERVFNHQLSLPGSVAGHSKDRHGFENHTSNGFSH